MTSLISSTRAVLSELQTVINQLEEADYSQSLAVFGGNSIGSHTRHVIELFQCLIEQGQSTGVVNYDLRSRNLVLSTSLEAADIALSEIIAFVSNYRDSGKNLVLNSGTESAPVTVANSTWDRELHYNIEHAIHHMALIRIGLYMVRPDLQLPSSFGVAPSTIAFKQQRA